MPSQGTELITDIGEAKLNQALGSGVAVQITHIALGDGFGANYNPGPGQIALKRERARKPIERQHMVGTNAWRVGEALAKLKPEANKPDPETQAFEKLLTAWKRAPMKVKRRFLTDCEREIADILGGKPDLKVV